MDGRDVVKTLMERDGFEGNLLGWLRHVGLRKKQPQYSKWLAGDQASIDPANVIPLAKRFKVDLMAFYDPVAAGRAVRELKKLPIESPEAAIVPLPPSSHSLAWPFASTILEQISKLSPDDRASIETALAMTVSALATRRSRLAKGGGGEGTKGTSAPGR